MSETQKKILKALLLIQQCDKPSDVRMVGMNLLAETQSDVKEIIEENDCKEIEEVAWKLSNGCSEIYCLLLCVSMEFYLRGIVQGAKALRNGVEEELIKRGYKDDNKKPDTK